MIKSLSIIFILMALPAFGSHGDFKNYDLSDVTAVLESKSWLEKIDDLKMKYSAENLNCVRLLNTSRLVRIKDYKNKDSDLQLTIHCFSTTIIDHNSSGFPLVKGFNLQAKVRIKNQTIDSTLEVFDLKINPSFNEKDQSNLGEFTCSNNFGNSFTMEVAAGEQFIYNFPGKTVSPRGLSEFGEMVLSSGICREVLSSIAVGDDLFNPYLSSYLCGPYSFAVYFGSDSSNEIFQTTLHPTTIAMLFVEIAPRAAWFCRYHN